MKKDKDPLQPAPDEESSQSFADKLEERLINFAVRIIKLAARLPKTPAGRHVSGQILRAGTSPAPNYGEARGAESRPDFVHKISCIEGTERDVRLASHYRTQRVVKA